MKLPAGAWLLGGLIVGMLAVLPTPALAALPDAYAPVVVQPTGGPDRAEFDLGPVLARARREHKSLYVYLGASDCPFCRNYEAFLRRNATELVPHFAKKYIVVDLRSSLRMSASRLYFRRDGSSLGYVEFLQQMGDVRTRQLVYPSVWLLDGEAKPLMQMPAGTGTFETVDEQLEILQLVQ